MCSITHAEVSEDLLLKTIINCNEKKTLKKLNVTLEYLNSCNFHDIYSLKEVFGNNPNQSNYGFEKYRICD